jgi:hypothetical protein
MVSRSVKKEYKIGDNAWVYGVTTGPGYNRPCEGQVIHSLEIPGHSELHYIVEIQNGIEPLLEVRTWGTMSQDAKGPVGSLREVLMNRHAEQKMLLRTGMRLPDVELNPEFVDEQESDQDQD